jgi:hypothetical protein
MLVLAKSVVRKNVFLELLFNVEQNGEGSEGIIDPSESGICNCMVQKVLAYD